ncbi:MAG: methyltransferase family protein [Vulcanimicrobiaceae bacterium]
MNERSSPWWYRGRGYVSALIFVFGFYGCSAIWWLLFRNYTPAFVAAGARWGDAGVGAALIVAVLFTLICFLIRAWGSAYLSSGIVWNPNARTDALLVDGPFRYTRNPLYLGNLLMVLGLGVLATPLGYAVTIVLHLLFIRALIRWEEQGLSLRYGDAFERYRAQVPAYLPRLFPAPAQLAGAPSLVQGIRAEIFSACVVLAMLALLLLGQKGIPGFALLLVAGWIAQLLATRSQRRALPG